MPKTKVKFKNLKSVINSINAVFEDTKTSTNLLKDIGRYSANRVRAQTQTGKQLTTRKGKDGPVGTQPPLSKGYVNYRRRLKEGSVKGSKVRPSKLMRPGLSHLTLTGQLMKSIGFLRSAGTFLPHKHATIQAFCYSNMADFLQAKTP